MAEKKHILEKYQDYLDGKAEHFSFELLSLYINFYGDLSYKERHLFEQHLIACNDCRERFNEVFDTELELEKKTTLLLAEENTQISATDSTLQFKFTSQVDPQDQSQNILSTDDSISIDIQFKPDHSLINIVDFPEEFLGRAAKITVPEIQSVGRIIALQRETKITLPETAGESPSQITQIEFEFASPIPEAVQESSWLDRIPFVDIPPSRLAAAAVVLIIIIAAYFIFYPDRPDLDESLISQQVEAEAYQTNPLLENFIDRTLRSEAQVTNLIPMNGDTVSTPIHFQWQQVKGKMNYTLTILDNKNHEIWREGTSFQELEFGEVLNPGLYYWKLQVGDEGVMVRKFFIK